MPLKEYACEACGAIEERYMRRWDTPPPDCPVCLGPRTELASRFGVVFTGRITARYNEPGRENSHMEGFWTYRKRSSVSGQPEPVFIEDWQQLKNFNKAEGLAAPGDVPTHSTITPDGRRIVSDGMPGQWRGSLPAIPARLQEIIDAPIEAFKEVGASVTPSMPMSYGVKPEVSVMTEGST